MKVFQKEIGQTKMLRLYYLEILKINVNIKLIQRLNQSFKKIQLFSESSRLSILYHLVVCFYLKNISSGINFIQ